MTISTESLPRRPQALAREVMLLLCLSMGCTKLDSPDDYFPKNSRMSANSGGTSTMVSMLSSGQSAVQLSGGQTHSDAIGATLAGAYSTAQAGTSSGGGTSDPCWYRDTTRAFECYQCPPKNILQMERACTDAECVAFDNATRLTRWSSDDDLPPLPIIAGGAANTTPALSAGTGGAAAVGRATAGAAGGSTRSQMNGGVAGTAGAYQGNTTSGVACEELLSKGKVVYLTGSSAAKPFLQEIARQLANLSVYVVYVPTGSCAGVDAVLNRVRLGASSLATSVTSALYWPSADSAGESCRLEATGITTDIGISDVFAQSCPGFELASLDALGIRDAHGPIQTMAFVVPSNSRQKSISAQAAYFVFGFGDAGGVVSELDRAPVWNDESRLLVRKPSSGTQAMLAAAIGVPSERWRGRACGSSDEVAEELLQAGLESETAAEKALGILAVDYIDSKDLRNQLRTLAFQDTKQLCSFYPDSTAASHDKRNVRDGHYPLFGPLHLLYRVDATGVPENSLARQEILDILGYLSGSKPLPNQVSLLSVYAQRGLVPECAMRVTRTHDGGNLLPFVPSNPCSCAFELAATGATACVACRVQADCRFDESCSMGYCEK